jgi:hypothetical protein
MKWLIPAGFLLIILILFGQTIRSADAVSGQLPLKTTPALEDHPVWLCRRLVDDWRVQLLFPGAEHYSIWLPQKKLHRGVTAAGLGQPLRWIDEFFLHGTGGQEWLHQGLTCEPIPNANTACVEGEVRQHRGEGLYSLTHHCQHVVLDVLNACGGQIPPLAPLLPYY